MEAEKWQQLKGGGFNIPSISLSAAWVVIKSSRVLQPLEFSATEWRHAQLSVTGCKKREIGSLLLPNGYHCFGQSISLHCKSWLTLQSVAKSQKLSSWGAQQQSQNCIYGNTSTENAGLCLPVITHLWLKQLPFCAPMGVAWSGTLFSHCGLETRESDYVTEPGKNWSPRVNADCWINDVKYLI